MSLLPHRVDYNPIIERPPIKWPNDARVALWIAPNVEHYEYMPDKYGPLDLGHAHLTRTCSSTLTATSATAWGSRMVEVLDQQQIRCCVSLNMAVLEHFPEIRDAMVDRDWDFMRHGIYNTRYLYAYMRIPKRRSGSSTGTISPP